MRHPSKLPEKALSSWLLVSEETSCISPQGQRNIQPPLDAKKFGTKDAGSYAVRQVANLRISGLPLLAKGILYCGALPNSHLPNGPGNTRFTSWNPD